MALFTKFQRKPGLNTDQGRRYSDQELAYLAKTVGWLRTMPNNLTTTNGTNDAADLIARTVRFVKAGLPVVVCPANHPEDVPLSFYGPFVRDLVAALTAAGIDPTSWICIQLGNEPDLYWHAGTLTEAERAKMQADWWVTAGKELTEIRKVHQTLPVGIPGALFASPGMLPRSVPFADPNVIYGVHAYEPHEFTHAANPTAGYVSNKAARLAELKGDIDWAKKNGLMLMFDETGCNRQTDLAGRVNYLSDIMSIGQDNGIPVAPWTDTPDGQTWGAFTMWRGTSPNRTLIPEFEVLYKRFTMAPTFLSARAFGLKGDGSDEQVKLQQWLDASKAQKLDAYLDPGIYGHSSTLKADSIRVYGDGKTSTLKALNQDYSSLYLTGDGPIAELLVIDGGGTRRGKTVNGQFAATDESAGICIQGATNFKVQDNKVYRTNTVGIFNIGGSKGYIRHNYVEGAFADSIHNTGAANAILVEFNETNKSGDDGVAVVSYGETPTTLCHDIEVANNYNHDSLSGRGCTLIGGRNIKIHDNYISNMHYKGDTSHPGGLAGIMVACESAYGFVGVHGAQIDRNMIIQCGGPPTGHGAFHLNCDGGSGIDGVTGDGNIVALPAGSWLKSDGLGAIQAILTNSVVYAASITPENQNAPHNVVATGTVPRAITAFVDPGPPKGVGPRSNTVQPPEPPMPPSYKITLISPQNGATIKGAVNITGTADGMLNVMMRKDTTPLAEQKPDAAKGYAFSFPLDTTKYPDGDLTLNFLAWDVLAGQNNAAHSAGFDPVVTLTLRIANAAVPNPEVEALKKQVADLTAANAALTGQLKTASDNLAAAQAKITAAKQALQ